MAQLNSEKLKPYAPLFLALATLGLLLSLPIHILSFFDIPAMERWPVVSVLHIGVLIVFGLAISLNQKEKDGRSDQDLDDEFKHAPRWLNGLTGLFTVSAVIHFAICFASGTPEHLKDGTYALMNHGKLIRAITEQEFHQFNARSSGMFSGFWLIFYSQAMVMITHAIKRDKALGDELANSTESKSDKED